MITAEPVHLLVSDRGEAFVREAERSAPQPNGTLQIFAPVLVIDVDPLPRGMTTGPSCSCRTRSVCGWMKCAISRACIELAAM